ncbi:MAG: M10 family metallopeptidase C-terminal domain-containing protein [Magnetococcales bacterium]|nr:M10 family metallopeptidase C-terminal domain-containing protein [Magnetococcales bacterium]
MKSGNDLVVSLDIEEIFPANSGRVTIKNQGSFSNKVELLRPRDSDGKLITGTIDLSSVWTAAGTSLSTLDFSKNPTTNLYYVATVRYTLNKGIEISGNSVVGTAKSDTVTLLTGGHLRVRSVESITGSSDTDTITLLNSNKVLLKGVETIVGSTGADTVTLTGTTAAVIRGGGGADKLTGGSGSNRFRYSSAAESSPTAKDTLTNFNFSRDVIEILASLRSGSGNGTFIGSTAFNGKGQCQVRFDDKSKLLEIDLDGKSNKKAEMAMTLTGVKLADLRANSSWLSWSG